MMTWRSIEFRLTAWYAVALFAGFVLVTLVLLWAVRYAVQDAIDDRLLERMERLVNVVAEEIAEEASDDEDDEDEPAELRVELEEELNDYVFALPEGALSQIRDAGDRPILPIEGEAILAWRRGGEEPELYTAEAEGVRFRVVIQEVGQEVGLAEHRYGVLLASSLEVLDDIRTRVFGALVVVTPLALLLSCGGGFLIARRALQPVDVISKAASAITVTNLERRIPSRDSGDALERLTTTFNAMLERLQVSVARIEQFSADASHELRTPISVIRTTAELGLRHGRTPDGYRADLADIETESKQLSDLIDVLLMLARDGGANDVPMTYVDLVHLVSEVTRRFQSDAKAKALKLELETPDRVVEVVGNEAALRRMLASLLENALAHTESGSITVLVDEEAACVRLCVRDTGEGIPEEALAHIFDRFYRVNASRSRSEGRVGLGLSIAKRIAELHRAELTVESRAGEGALFTVRFIHSKSAALARDGGGSS